jgi:hypothetical protein
MWYKHGKLHRENGPAIVWPDGSMMWYQNNLWHNTNGPAMIWFDGTKDYYLNGGQYTKEQWKLNRSKFM